MEINLKNAITKFYPNPSLEMVYFEAIANSIDAKADKIEIQIQLSSITQPETLEIEIVDNGEGFDEENFNKFGTLLENNDKFHKGLGRLVYLQYFNKVEVESYYKLGNRKFTFDSEFKKMSTIEVAQNSTLLTKLSFLDYSGKGIRSYGDVVPSLLMERIKLNFYPLLYSRKLNGEDLTISISLTVGTPNVDAGFINSQSSIQTSNLPDLKKFEFEEKRLDLYSDFVVYYQIERNHRKTSIITALSVDGRIVNLGLLSSEDIPSGYEMLFIFSSSFFDGKASNTREDIDLDRTTFEQIKTIFKDQIKEILQIEVPEIDIRNKATVKVLKKRFPFLKGYVNENVVGLANQDSLVDDAQRRFFKDQKAILESDHLTDHQYNEALKLSSRVLAEYIIYRQKIINKLKQIDIRDSEHDIHELIVPTKEVLNGERFIEDVYRNNIWLLDDKFMTYSTVLSEMEMRQLIPNIKLDEESTDISRPDIAIVFSKDPTESKKLVDVVIVELKKTGLKLAKKEEVVSQLRQRARKLLEYYPNQIGRIWFYGIVDMHEEFIVSLIEDDYFPVYSEDEVFYKEQKIIVDRAKNIIVPVGLNILSYKALLDDADSRNSTFLKILIDNIDTFSNKN